MEMVGREQGSALVFVHRLAASGAVRERLGQAIQGRD